MPRPRKGKRIETPEGTRVFGKNANGEGSVYRQADGRWCATWWAPGEKRPRRATGKTREAAIKRREERRAKEGPGVGALEWLPDLAHWWLHNVHRDAVRPSSWAKAEDRVRRIKVTLAVRVPDLDYQIVAEWQAKLLFEGLAPRTVRHHRQTLAQVVDEGVKLGLLPGNPVRMVKPPRIPPGNEIALERHQMWALLEAIIDHLLAAAVALLFLHGWRISEVLGLAWEDIEFEFAPDPDNPDELSVVGASATVRRASVYVDGQGQQLGPTKTDGALGVHWLMPTVAQLLWRRKQLQDEQRAAAPHWETITYQGEVINIVFTTPTGGLVLRQTVAKLIKQAAKTAGLDVDIATHTGRRTVITILYTEGEEALDDIGRFVGQAKTETTERYVKRLGHRPRNVADRARGLLERPEDTPTGEVRNHPGGSGSNDGSYDPGKAGTGSNGGDRSPSSDGPGPDVPEPS